MKYDIDWERPIKSLSTSVIIGRSYPHASILYTITKHICRWDSNTNRDLWETDYSVGFEIGGIWSSVVLATKNEVIKYLNNQDELLPEYLELIGKRNKLYERIKPLQNKASKYGNDILILAKAK